MAVECCQNSAPSTSLQPLEKAHALARLAENAFNYDIFGREGFEMLVRLVDRSACYAFEYSRLPEAIELFNRLAEEPAVEPAVEPAA